MRKTNFYPTNADGLVCQCAWCRTVADTDGTYSIAAGELFEEASHGICPTCLTGLLDEVDRRRSVALAA